MYIHYLPNSSGPTVIPNPFWIISVDPGITNVGFRVERRYWKQRKERKILIRIDMVWMEVLDFSADTFPQTLIKMQNFLLLTLCFLHRASIIIIEEQLSKQNPLVSRVGQHWLTFYLTSCRRMPLRPSIYEIHSQTAKRFLGISRGLGAAVKGEIHTGAMDILTRGKDQKSLDKLLTYKKTYQYHLTDSIVQAEAICKEEGYPSLA